MAPALRLSREGCLLLQTGWGPSQLHIRLSAAPQGREADPWLTGRQGRAEYVWSLHYAPHSAGAITDTSPEQLLAVMGECVTSGQYSSVETRAQRSKIVPERTPPALRPQAPHSQLFPFHLLRPDSGFGSEIVAVSLL